MTRTRKNIPPLANQPLANQPLANQPLANQPKVSRESCVPPPEPSLDLLVPYQGMPMLRWCALQALQSGCGPVTVVLGANADLVEPVLDGLPLEIVGNPDWKQGMGTSIHAGLRAAIAAGCERAILTLGDLPLVPSEYYQTLLATQQRIGVPVVASSYADTVGVPALFGAHAFEALLALPARRGCKAVILLYGANAAHVPCPEASADIDTPEDYQRHLK